MPTIGERLRTAREAKGLALEDAHRQTKIHTRILQAMEQDRTSEVLETAYAKGFIKKYAAFLNLDAAPLVQEYLRADHPTAIPVVPRSARDGAPSVEASSGLPRWLVPAIVGLMALVGLVFLGYLMKDLYRTLSTPGPTATIAHKPAPGVSPAPLRPALVPKSQPLKLTIRASQDCWMQVKSDDKVLFQEVLGKGREESWTANEAIELWVGNAAALTLILNGRPMEPLGYGVIKGIRVTHAGLDAPKKPHHPS